MGYRLIFLTALLWSLCGSPALAQDLPDNSKLHEEIRHSIPEYWNIVEFRRIVESRTGDAVQPKAAIRFEATVKPTESLFVELREEAPFVIVSETMRAEDPRTLYGYFDFIYNAGDWDSSLVIENPVSNLGQPLDFFEGPPLIAGSEEADAKIEQLRNEVISGLISAFRAKLAEMKSQHDVELSRVVSEHEVTINERRREHRAALAALADELEGERASLMEQHRDTVVALEDDFASRIDKLREEHADQRGRIIQSQRREISELNTRLETERAGLLEQLEAAEDTIELQRQLTTALQTRNEGSAELQALLSSNAAQRAAFFESLPKTMSGTLHCTPDSGDGVMSRPLYMFVSHVTANGLGGTLSFYPDRQDASSIGVGNVNISLVEEDLVFPLAVRMSAGGPMDFARGRRVVVQAELQYSANGVFSGKNDMQGEFASGKWTTWPCEISLSGA